MINPSNDRVLIKPIDLEAISGGGIVLGGGAKDTRLHGKVMAIGPGRQNAAGNLIPVTQCKVGDEVIYGNVANTCDDRLDNGEKCVLVVAEAIVGVIV
jgi:chaperonin GroES